LGRDPTYAQKPAICRTVSFQDTPCNWPLINSSISNISEITEKIESFVALCRPSAENDWSSWIRKELLLYHPDRFEGDILPLVHAEEIDQVRSAAAMVCRIYTDIKSRNGYFTQNL